MVSRTKTVLDAYTNTTSSSFSAYKLLENLDNVKNVSQGKQKIFANAA